MNQARYTALLQSTCPAMFSWLWKRGTITVWPFSFFIGTYQSAQCDLIWWVHNHKQWWMDGIQLIKIKIKIKIKKTPACDFLHRKKWSRYYMKAWKLQLGNSDHPFNLISKLSNFITKHKKKRNNNNNNNN